MGRCGRRTARRATHPRTASQAGDALIDQTSGLADHYEEERCHELISVLLSPVSRTASRHAAICMPFFHHTSLAHTSHHAQPRAIASTSHARASGMHTPTRQPHTPCGPSVCVCRTTCLSFRDVKATSSVAPTSVHLPQLRSLCIGASKLRKCTHSVLTVLSLTRGPARLHSLSHNPYGRCAR